MSTNIFAQIAKYYRLRDVQDWIDFNQWYDKTTMTIMTKPASKAYEEGWERIYGKKKQDTVGKTSNYGGSRKAGKSAKAEQAKEKK